MQPPAASTPEGRQQRATPKRMFFALWPDEPARTALAALATAIAASAGGRATAAANLHLTLAFVGDVLPDRIEALRDAGRSVATNVSPFTVALDRLGEFRTGGIAWIGAARIPPALSEIAQRLARTLSSAGFDVDRRAYAPHLTLARKCRKLPAGAPEVRIAWQVDELALVESALHPRGPRYSDDSRWSLVAGV